MCNEFCPEIVLALNQLQGVAPKVDKVSIDEYGEQVKTGHYEARHLAHRMKRYGRTDLEVVEKLTDLKNELTPPP